MDESDIERELADAQAEAQAAVITSRKARLRRQAAVMLARGCGWSKYRIAATLGVKGPTVDAIISAAEREQDKQ